MKMIGTSEERPLPETTRRFEAVHPWHLHVHENDGELTTFAKLDRFLPDLASTSS